MAIIFRAATIALSSVDELSKAVLLLFGGWPMNFLTHSPPDKTLCDAI